MEIAKTASMGSLLAAIAAKYPEVRISTDELQDAATRSVTVIFDRKANSWRLSPRAKRVEVTE